MKTMPAILTATLDGAKPLGDRVSAVLSTPAASSAAVAALLAEVTDALGAARTGAVQAEARALDPVLDTVAAGHASQVAQDANFAARRLEAAETRLTEFHAQRSREEIEAEQWNRYRAVEKERDALAERIKREYPDLARGMVELVKASIEGAVDVIRVNNDLPPNAPRLDSPEGKARGFVDNGKDGTPGALYGAIPLAAAFIPDPDRFEWALWPLNFRADSLRAPDQRHAAAVESGRYRDIKAGIAR